MPSYKLEIFEPPERLRHRREFVEVDDTAAIKWADAFYDGELSAGVTLDRYVLYKGVHIVRERVE